MAGLYLKSHNLNLSWMFTSFDSLEEHCFLTPSGSMPDELLPMLLPTPGLESNPSPNLDILLSKLLNND